jgi:hypothetical protein
MHSHAQGIARRQAHAGLGGGGGGGAMLPDEGPVLPDWPGFGGRLPAQLLGLGGRVDVRTGRARGLADHGTTTAQRGWGAVGNSCMRDSVCAAAGEGLMRPGLPPLFLLVVQ